MELTGEKDIAKTMYDKLNDKNKYCNNFNTKTPKHQTYKCKIQPIKSL